MKELHDMISHAKKDINNKIVTTKNETYDKTAYDILTLKIRITILMLIPTRGHNMIRHWRYIDRHSKST